VYSYGVLLAEMIIPESAALLPRSNYDTKTEYSLSVQVADLSFCPDSLKQLIKSCLDDQPAQRPPFKQICLVLANV